MPEPQKKRQAVRKHGTKGPTALPGRPEGPTALPGRPEPASLEPEQIGTLTFVPNPEYPYPFDVATPPRFWMEETTGVLADAVDAYIGGEKLSNAQLDVLKLYLNQYLERAVLAGDANRKLLLQQIAKLRTVADVERFADQASEYGAEVF